MSTLIIVVWSTMLSALKDVLVLVSTSSVSGFRVEVVSVVLVSLSFLSSTSGIAHISTDKFGTIVVIPEVVRSQWSPVSISGFSVDPTFRGHLEFTSYLDKLRCPWFT